MFEIKIDILIFITKLSAEKLDKIINVIAKILVEKSVNLLKI